MKSFLLPDVQTKSEKNQLTVDLSGYWTALSLMVNQERRAKILADFAFLKQHSVAHWDLSNIKMLDHFGAQVLWRLWGYQLPTSIHLSDKQRLIFNCLQRFGQYGKYTPPSKKVQPIVALGTSILIFLTHLKNLLSLLGAVIIGMKRFIFQPKSIPWVEISMNTYRFGVQALPIVALVAFLIGIVLSYLSAQQLQVFGANRFIVNILGLSVIRELGPMIVAILVAGRSGSAITAQIGVMRLTEELDAMQVMGISYINRLVIPRVIALAIAMPLLIMWTNTIALIGGAIAARFTLGIDYYYFFHMLPTAVPQINLWFGLGKGIAFGVLIAVVASYFGLKVQPNSQSLGAGTTISVVTSITLVILADAIFAILFQNIGLSL